MSINLARENQELSKEKGNNYLHVYMSSMYNNKESGHGYIINIKVTITVVRVYHH